MQVVRCCIEHAASVAKTFLTSNAVVIDRMELEQPLQRRKPMTMPRKPMAMPRMPMTNSGIRVGSHLKNVLYITIGAKITRRRQNNNKKCLLYS